MIAFVDPDLCIGCTSAPGCAPPYSTWRRAGRGRARPHPAGGSAPGGGRRQRLPGKRHPHRGVKKKPFCRGRPRWNGFFSFLFFCAIL